MPKLIPSEQKMMAINLMLAKDVDGKPLYGQRTIERETGLSRPYLRKLSHEIGWQFFRNGKEVVGQLCVCANCGCYFRKPLSRILRAGRQFCDLDCRQSHAKGVNHPNWSGGSSTSSFSQWCKSQSEYKTFREKVLERDGHKCVISGRTEGLQVHHILHKAESEHPEKVFDPNNGIVLNEDVHIEIHKLTRAGKSFDEAVVILKERYKNG